MSKKGSVRLLFDTDAMPAKSGHLIGYARVSTADQNEDLQVDALDAAGCDRIFTDKVTGVKADRPELDALLSYIREGDTLVVWRLDRLGRSSRHLTELVEDLQEKGVAFRSLTEGLDTSTSTGKLIFQIFAAMAEFERNLIVERTNAGLQAARARGRKGGRVRQFGDDKVKIARKLYASEDYTVQEIATTLNVSRGTIYNYIGDLVKKPEDPDMPQAV